ncbi:hypothetical protein HPB52_008251 [Rhipicephalus sanguineus]|uniref:P2X purinoreceptor 7 intracellular domain-containing protein n=1 Tax=Rhipicephalus sanguineus TaxID=34632 RepID=A0A9D4Q5M2_RHISA|nr:hypothetical protein HPB52_008251 [Rhipicephalus sanguineus]
MDASVRARLERLARIMDPYRDTPRRIPATAVRDDAPSPDSPPSPGEGDDVRWCFCGHCLPSTNAEENVCCRVVPEVVAKGNDDCITRHADFSSVCLNAAVLEATFYILADFDVQMDAELHKKYRFVAYRLFTKWVWKRLGRHNRVVLPACVVARIRHEYPSATYVGFQHPHLD